ncbi:MAG: winged helix-turn-helix transcriptional regulator [Mycobacterium sp.]|uniref:winged helix-turn-helix transcriptional regulator n=1 Tax=Mycobacterium sp. TaxID=1785 RepID=UPI003F9A9F8C
MSEHSHDSEKSAHHRTRRNRALTFPKRLSLAREYGGTTAYVYELILLADTGDGAAIAHADIAEKLSISVSSVQRSIRELTQGGLLKAEDHQRKLST